jgi:hypothetical protein
MAFDIAAFKSRGLNLGGARPTLFQVSLTPPFAVQSNVTTKFTFTCQATQIPAADIAEIPVPYFGRQIKLAGDRTFPNWDVTVINDEDYAVRNMFEQWSNLMNTHATNQKLLPGNTYKSTDALVTHFSKDGVVIKQYSFVGIFPTTVSPMDLSWASTNQVQTFNVSFAYDYWVPYVSAGVIGGSTAILTGEAGNQTTTISG